MASDLPAGPDLSKAKAWCVVDASSVINASYNVKSITDNGTGDYYINWGIPFKSGGYVVNAASGTPLNGGPGDIVPTVNGGGRTRVRLYCTEPHSGVTVDTPLCVACFGELENE